MTPPNQCFHPMRCPRLYRLGLLRYHPSNYRSTLPVRWLYRLPPEPPFGVSSLTISRKGRLARVRVRRRRVDPRRRLRQAVQRFRRLGGSGPERGPERARLCCRAIVPAQDQTTPPVGDQQRAQGAALGATPASGNYRLPALVPRRGPALTLVWSQHPARRSTLISSSARVRRSDFVLLRTETNLPAEE